MVHVGKKKAEAGAQAEDERKMEEGVRRNDDDEMDDLGKSRYACIPSATSHSMEEPNEPSGVLGSPIGVNGSRMSLLVQASRIITIIPTRAVYTLPA